MAYLLDSDHCIYLNNGTNKAPNARTETESRVCQAFAELQDDVFMAEVTLGELCFGAAKSKRSEENQAHVDELVEVVKPLPLNEGVWREFGRKKAELLASGKSMGDFDILIACTAHIYRLTLVTRDRHFGMLPSSYLEIESWAE